MQYTDMEALRGVPGPEAEMPRCEDEAKPYETYCAGSTPVPIGDWIASMVIKAPTQN